jgi:DNA-directed RNA polymerase subunit alpha
VAYAARLLRSHFQLFLEEGATEEEVAAQTKETQPTSVLDVKVDQLDLSMRSINCLRAAGITTVEELVLKSENDMLKYRNFGRKSLIELTEKLEKLGVRFGMTPEDVAQVRASGISVPPEFEIAEDKKE